MSRINQIQNRLRGLSPGAFQKLGDAYLHSRGYERINPLGSVIGSDKVRKGTPDTLIPLETGKYVFAEHTTVDDARLVRKLQSDLRKCFDEVKTGVPVDRIEEVVFCHTSTLRPADEDALAQECKKRGVNLRVFGMGVLSYDLLWRYPAIARDFLGVEVDTGQVVHLDEFVAANDRSPLATPLATGFHFRDSEVKQVLLELDRTDLVIVSGHAGVGKSRLGVECCRRFEATHPEYTVWCVFNRYDRDLFEDLRVYLSAPGHHLLLVDDANRIARFEYIVRLLQDQRDDQRIKVVATVRDYALDKIRDAARSYGIPAEVELRPLEERQIKQLVEAEHDIHHPLYLDRIAEIAQGNPRLAIMAAVVAKRENTLRSLRDVSTLYNEYYKSIRQDLEDLGDQALLKVAGVVAFLRAVDCSQGRMMDEIEAAFGVSKDAFLVAAQRLHDLELLDVWEDEVVRTSDQVLMTYLFYVAFFKEGLLDFPALLRHFFPGFRHRLVDSLSPVLSWFGGTTLSDAMRPGVDEAWRALEEAGDDTALLHLMGIFWFLKETDTLRYVQDRILAMQPEPVDLSVLQFEIGSSVASPSLLDILSLFGHSDEERIRVALELVLDYVAKRPSELSAVLWVLADRLGFKHRSYLREFVVQRLVIDALWGRTREGSEELYSRLFLALATQYLHIRFHLIEATSKHAITAIDFQLFPLPELHTLRRTILTRVFQLYRVPALRDSVLDALARYCTANRAVAAHEIVAQDAADVIPFIGSELTPESYRHCLVAQHYLELLDANDVSFEEGLRDRFVNETYTLSKLLLVDRAECKESGHDFRLCRQLKDERIKQYFEGYCLEDYKRLIEQCLVIRAGLDQDRRNEEPQLRASVLVALLALADRDPDLYVDVCMHYLGLGDPLDLNRTEPIEKLVEIYGADRAYEALCTLDRSSTRAHLFSFYRSLQREEATAERLSQLYALYREARCRELPRDLDFLLDYRAIDPGVVARVTEMILGKGQDCIHALSALFDPWRQVSRTLLDHFTEDLDLLKRAYFAVLESDRFADFDASTMTRILDADSNFLLQYVDWLCTAWRGGRCYEDTHDYTFLWRRGDCPELMARVVEHIHARRYGGSIDLLKRFFAVREGSTDRRAVREEQDRLLRGLIVCRCDDPDFMGFLFELVARFPSERSRPLVELYLDRNKRFEEFKKLPLLASSWGGERSLVPSLLERVEYLESLLSLLNTVELLPHRQHLERRIRELRKEIEFEKKMDFLVAD